MLTKKTGDVDHLFFLMFIIVFAILFWPLAILIFLAWSMASLVESPRYLCPNCRAVVKPGPSAPPHSDTESEAKVVTRSPEKDEGDSSSDAYYQRCKNREKIHDQNA